jgi:hypothetical protein
MGRVPFKVQTKKKATVVNRGLQRRNLECWVDYILLLSRAAHGNERRARAARQAQEEKEVNVMRQILL